MLGEARPKTSTSGEERRGEERAKRRSQGRGAEEFSLVINHFRGKLSL